MSRNLSHSLSRLFSIRAARPSPKPSGARRGRRLWAPEGLEDRVVLSPTLYTVNAVTDTGAGTGTTGDLRYVIGRANGDPNPDGSLIRFDPTAFSSPQTITLSSTLELSGTAGPEVIDGPGAN